jgi:hypothetical protein
MLYLPIKKPAHKVKDIMCVLLIFNKNKGASLTQVARLQILSITQPLQQSHTCFNFRPYRDTLYMPQ